MRKNQTTMGVIEDLQKVLQTVVAPQMESITVRLDLLEKRGDRLELRMDRVEQKLDRMDERLGRMAERIRQGHDDLTRQQQSFEERLIRGHEELARQMQSFEERMIRNQEAFKADVIHEIRQALNYQALSQRMELIEKKALS